MTERGRPSSLGAEHVPLVQQWLLSGVSKAEVAARFSVHRNTVGTFCRRYEIQPLQDFSAVNDTPDNRETAKQIARAYAVKFYRRLMAEGVKGGETEELNARFLMVAEKSMRRFNPGRGVKFSTYLIAGFLNAYRTYRRELKQQAGRIGSSLEPVKRRRRRVTCCRRCGAVIVPGSRPARMDKRRCPYCFAGEVGQVAI